MPKLVKHDSLEGKDFLKRLAKQDVLVYEDVQGAKIWVSWDGLRWSIRPRHVTDEPINMVDLAMQKYYNSAHLYFSTLAPEVADLVNPKWHFCFEYFADEQPANVRYGRVPKNNLILTCICKGRRQYSYDPDELAEYARLFDVEVLPIIYRGRLSQRQVELLHYFLNTSAKDLSMIFSDTNFSRFFYQVLNPSARNSFLMRDGEFQDNLERVVMRFEDDGGEVALQVLNPMYARDAEATNTDFAEVYSLLLLNFMVFCQGVDVDTLPVKGRTRDELYLDAVCRLYNMYMMESASDILSFDFSVPAFFDQEKFRINKDFISNRATLDWLRKSTKLEYVLKIILSSLQKHKKRAHGVFTDKSVASLNSLIDRLKRRIDTVLMRNRETQKFADKLLDFDEFHKHVAWDSDASGKVYPTFDDQLDALDGGKKKGKKGIMLADTGKKKGYGPSFGSGSGSGSNGEISGDDVGLG